MNAIVISEDTLAEQLAGCADGETGDFTVKGGTLHLVPGVGAVVSFEDITKKGYKAKEKDADADDPDEETMPRKGMSAAAKAVVGRKAPSY